MTPLDDFLPLIRGRLPGCPETLLRDATRAAAIEFCKRTQLLTQTVEFEVVAGEPAVTLYPDSDVHWEVLDVRRGASSLTGLNRREFILQNLGQDAGTPGYYYLEGDRTLLLGPVPDASETLSALVTLRPKDTASRLDDVLFSDYREIIAAGARAWVRRNHGDWSEPSLEGHDRKLFEDAIHNQNIRRARGGAGVALRVRAHPF